MEKISSFFGWLKKKGFWLGSALLAIAMIAAWFFATSKIDKQTADATSEVKKQVSSVQAIMQIAAEEGVLAHPNSSTEAGMRTELKEALDENIAAWKLRYDAQQPILKWPTKIIGSEEFVSIFSPFNPPETFPERYTGGRGMEHYLELYRNTIPKQMEHLCRDVLRAKWLKDPEYIQDEDNAFASSSRMPQGVAMTRGPVGPMGGSRGPVGPPGGMGGQRGPVGPGGGGGGRDDGPSSSAFDGPDISPEDLGKFAVVWNAQNQDLWYRKLTQFKGRDDHYLAVEAPTPLQVYMLQQDLWLLEAMFNIIRSINGDVTANDLASIKRIDHIALGREARTQLGTLMTPDARLAGAGAAAEEDSGSAVGGGYGYGSDGGEELDGGEGSGVFTPTSDSPYDGRYVDVDFKPIPADVVRSVLTADELPSENLELIVAKRVPFRIALKMDERQIPEFITGCANSPFAFEVNQVRLNRHIPGAGISIAVGGHGMTSGASNDAAETDVFGGSGLDTRGGMGASLMGPMGGMGGTGRDGGGYGYGGGFGGSGGNMSSLIPLPVETRTNYDVDVEFYGIVKIYNPVRPKILRAAAGLENEEPDPLDAAQNSRTPAFKDTSVVAVAQN